MTGNRNKTTYERTRHLNAMAARKGGGSAGAQGDLNTTLHAHIKYTQNINKKLSYRLETGRQQCISL